MGRANLGISEVRGVAGVRGIAGALGLVLGCTPTPPPRPPDVLLVVLDTVRADALPIGGNPRNTAPQVQAIADAGRVFTQAVAPGCWTWPVHASLFTGQDPWVHGAHHAALDDVLAGAPIATSLDRSLPTLAEAFTAAGYRTASISANGLLGPGSELVRGFAQAELYDDDDDRVVQRAQQLLSDDDPRPVFIFVNLLGSHLPYEAWPTAWTAPHAAALHPDTAPDWLGPWLSVESGRPHLRLNRPAPDGGPAPVRAFSAGQWSPGPEGLALLKDVYESEVLATDALLHRLMQTWNATGRGAGITLVTSDHGEHFGEQDMLDHGHGVWGAVTHVPLVIAAPGRVVPGTDDQPVSLSRVAPTLISLAGIEGAAATAILTQPSLLAEDVPAAPVVSACWADPVWAQQLGGRFVHDQWMLRDGPLALVELGDNSLMFNILDDPMMLKDLSSAQPDAVRRLRALLAQQRPPTTDRTGERPTLSPGTIEAMQQLGYLEPPPGPPVETDHAALPVRWVQARPVRDPPRFANAERWRSMLLEAGLLVEVRTSCGPDDPRAWVLAIQGLLRELAHDDAQVEQLQTRLDTRRWRGFSDLPWWLILGLFVAPGMMSWAVYTLSDHISAPALVMLVGGLAPVLLLLPIGQAERARAWLRNRSRDTALEGARAAREQTRSALLDGVSAILERSFVARIGTQLLARCADEEWVHRRAQEAHALGALALAAALHREEERLKTAMQHALEHPPEDWTAEGMVTDRSAWAAELDAVRQAVPRASPEQPGAPESC